MLLVKMPLINLSILRSRVDARPPSRPRFSPGAGGSRVIGGAGPGVCGEEAVPVMPVAVAAGVAGTVNGGGEPAGGPGCKSLLSKVLLLPLRGDSFPRAPPPWGVVAAAAERVTAAAAPGPAALFAPLGLAWPSLSGHDRRLPGPLPAPALAPLVVTVLQGLGAGGGGATLSLRLPVPGCGEDEPGMPPPPARPSGSGPPQLGLLSSGRREAAAAPPDLGSGLSAPGAGGAAQSDRRRPPPGTGDTGRAGLAAGLAGATRLGGSAPPPAPALLVLIHSASCRWKSRSCRFLPGSSAPRGLPGSPGWAPPGVPAEGEGEGGGGGTDSSLTRVSEMR